MNNTEILSNLRTLGLDAGATADDIHAAFRKLAREYIFTESAGTYPLIIFLRGFCDYLAVSFFVHNMNFG